MRSNYLFTRTLPLVTVAGLLLCSCSTVAPNPPFNEAEFQPYLRSGTSTITGQAFLKTRGGEVRFAAGNTVNLTPLTSYTRTTLEQVIVRGQKAPPADPRFPKYVRTTFADGNGNFEFKNVPAGQYLAYVPILWEVPTQYGAQQTGGFAYAHVTAKPGETVKVVASR